MPYSPKRPCRHPGCREFCEPGNQYCRKHQAEQPTFDELRDNAARRGYDRKWREARKLFLQKHPLCEHCLKEGRIVPATVVDHVIPHRGDKVLFWDESNWSSLCSRCHNKKTASGR